MSTLDRPIHVTFFANFAATRKAEQLHTPRALAEGIRTATAPSKEQLQWLKLAQFGNVKTAKGSLRHDANLRTVTGIEADYDGGRMDVDAARDLLERQGVASILYTSPSHTEDAPRWRVLCPLSEAVNAGEKMDRHAGLAPTDPLYSDRVADPPIQIHQLHPPAPCAQRKKLPADGVLLRRSQTIRPLQ